MYHPEGIACPSPCNRATNFTFLWKGWVITRWKKNILIPEAIFFRGGGSLEAALGIFFWGGIDHGCPLLIIPVILTPIYPLPWAREY